MQYCMVLIPSLKPCVLLILKFFDNYVISKSLQRPFNERWKMLEREVIEPRNYERQHIYQSRNPHYRYDLEPFRVSFEYTDKCLWLSWFLNWEWLLIGFSDYQVRRKDFWLLSTVNKLLKEFIPRLSHEADGLIFQVLEVYMKWYVHESQ